MDELARWAELEFAPWRGVRVDDLAVRLQALSEQDEAVFLFEVGTGSVGVVDKPSANPMYRRRAGFYRDFLERVARAENIGGSGTLALSLADRSSARPGLPVFEYQKQRGSPSMLLPDVDLLGHDWFRDEAYRDPVPFVDKRCEAIFVGATTGGVLTAEKVRTLDHPRLRAAAFFRDRPGVVFELPEIVQCDGPETEAMVRALGLGDRRREWPEHFAYRYLLSMDGNGANCSRVALALMGQGVLVKYNSPYLLFYFHGLEAWRDYLPVRRDDDVLALLAQAAGAVGRDAGIAMRSTAFAREYLTEPASMRYTGELLRLYLGMFGKS